MCCACFLCVVCCSVCRLMFVLCCWMGIGRLFCFKQECLLWCWLCVVISYVHVLFVACFWLGGCWLFLFDFECGVCVLRVVCVIAV